MKEFVMKRLKSLKYEYGYKIQKLDIELMMELGLEVPKKFKEIYKDGFNENELCEYIYFKEPICVEFIKRQYYIRDYVEFSNMNIYELELLLKIYNQRFQKLSNRINIVTKKELLNDLQVELNILVNEMLGVIYLKNKLLEDKNLIKVRK